MADLMEIDRPLKAIQHKLGKMWGWKHTIEGCEAWLMKPEDYQRLVHMLNEADAFMEAKLKLCKAPTVQELKYPEEPR